VSEADADILDVKVVIRCRDYRASFDFYRGVLGLHVSEQWDEPGDAGCVFSTSPDGSGGLIEIYAMREQDHRYDPAFSQPLTDDKVDIQLRTRDLDRWVNRLQGRWSFSEAESTSWGHRWIKLRDPDNLLVAIYEVLPG
jgi:catechol 2,3-dioxygenase-like lactoylglutathione lyase family enzyme